MKTRARKRESEKVVKRNVCLPPELDRFAGSVMAHYGFGDNFSAYVQAHIRNDHGLILPVLPSGSHE